MHGGRVLGPGARGARGQAWRAAAAQADSQPERQDLCGGLGDAVPPPGLRVGGQEPGRRSGGGTLLLPRGPPRWREAAGPGCEGGSALCWCPAGFPRLWKVGLAHGLDPLSPSAGAGGWAPGQRQSTCSRGFRLSLSLRVLKGTFLWLCPLPSIFRGRLRHTEASPGISALFTRGRTPSSATATAACTHWP